MYEENVSHEDFIQIKTHSSLNRKLAQAKPLKTIEGTEIGHFKERSFYYMVVNHRLKELYTVMELDLQSLFGLHVT